MMGMINVPFFGFCSKSATRISFSFWVLGWALLRLTEEGTLKGKLLSDAPEDARIRLTGRDQRIIGEFSEFTLA